MSSVTRLDDPTLERITRTILEQCAPRRIVLYGSRARGDADDESDYDVMVEMDALPEGDLELELIKVLFSEDVDIFLTTAEEYAHSATTTSRVREPRPGGTPGSVDMWVRRAESDFRSVLLEAKHGGDACTICFHAHQSSEKYIKAVIICLHRVPPRTKTLARTFAAG